MFVAFSSVFGDSGSPVYQLKGITLILNQTLGKANAASDVEPFNIHGEYFLAVSNRKKNGATMVDSVVYKWIIGWFSEIQHIPTNFATDVHYFTIDAKAFLAITNTKWSKVSVYQWSNGNFSVKVQDIPMLNVQRCCTMEVVNKTYLACGTSQSINATKIMMWNGIRFQHFQYLPSSYNKNLYCFKANGSAYIATSDFSEARDSLMFLWTDTAFALHQTIPFFSRSWASFVSPEGNTFLVVAEKGAAADGFKALSAVYKLTNDQFVLYQQLKTNAVQGICTFTYGGQLFMAIAQGGKSSPSFKSSFYIW